jgi:ribosome biogenesis protein MAK21
LNKPARLDEFFALLFKSIKADPDSQRVLSFVRRIIQMATLNEASYTAACLLIVSELVRCKNDLKFQLYSLEQIIGGKKAKTENKDNEDSEEEHFVDADKVEENKVQTENAGEEQKQSKGAYDPLKREPKYSNPESTPMYELLSLTMHTHPTVRLWASNLVQGLPVSYAGDPLLDFGMANFLDRIAYKNPKSLEKLKEGKFGSNRRMAAKEVPVN